jgi:hypothetical protein
LFIYLNYTPLNNSARGEFRQTLSLFIERAAPRRSEGNASEIPARTARPNSVLLCNVRLIMCVRRALLGGK